MTSEEPPNSSASPKIVIHSFKTTGGTARPIKGNKPGLPLGPPTRRTHKKSRSGCTRCKTRRVKCDEQKPACSRCSRGGFRCTYPNGWQSPGPEQTPSSDDSLMAFPSMISDTFTLQDMRFFHHFLIKAKPHLPIGNDAVWAREIPQFALQNVFLMHAILALGSTHLGRLTDNDSFEVQALNYRVRGLEGLRKAMAKESWNYGDADSMIAAGYSLMLQSAHLEDGLYDWMSLLRLVASVSWRVGQNQNIPREFDIRPSKHLEAIAPYLHLLPAIDPRLLSSGLTALHELRVELKDSAAVSFCETLEHTLMEHQASSQQGYLAFGETFGFWMKLPDAEFAACMDPLNGEMQLLLLYFISILLMMVPLGVIENVEGIKWSTTRHISGILGWTRHTVQNVPPHMGRHARYPESVIASATAEVNGLPFEGPSVLQFDGAHDLVSQVKALRLEESRLPNAQTKRPAACS